MAWKCNTKDFLKMMQVNSELFGDEILHIKDADEKYLIKYFEKTLANLIISSAFDVAVNSKYFNTTFVGKGDIGAIELKPDGFGLNIKQCMDIFYYINGRYGFDNLFHKITIHWSDCIIVLNYIDKGYRLSDCCNEYVLYYKPNNEFCSR